MSRRSRTTAGGVALVLVATACGGAGASQQPTGQAPRPASSQVARPPASGDGTTTTIAESRPAPTAPAMPTEDGANARVVASAPPPAPAPASGASTGSSAAVADGCRRVTDLDDDKDRWAVVDDGVMGGRSAGFVEVGDSRLRFSGNVVTAGGGFTSVRRALDGDELAGTDRVVMRVRADERVYGLTMEDAARSGRRGVSHRADLAIEPPTEPDGWSIATLMYDELDPRVFGQSVDAEPFDPERAREIGIIISDGQDGEFALIVDWIDACG